MTSRVVILGGGTGGTLAANRLRRRFSDEQMAITVVDQDDRHVYQPGLLFVPFGLAHVEDIVRPRSRQLHRGVDFVNRPVDRVDIDCNLVHLQGGDTLGYDVLVVASGASLVVDETEGLPGPGWMDKVFTFYTPEGAAALEAALATFDGGRWAHQSRHRRGGRSALQPGGSVAAALSGVRLGGAGRPGSPGPSLCL